MTYTDKQLRDKCCVLSPGRFIEIDRDGRVFTNDADGEVMRDPREILGALRFVRSSRGIDGSRIEFFRCFDERGRPAMCRRIKPATGAHWWEWWSEAHESGNVMPPPKARGKAPHGLS